MGGVLTGAELLLLFRWSMEFWDTNLYDAWEGLHDNFETLR
jgi:hypothetical protein